METLNEIKELIEKMSVDTSKVFKKGNKSASIRARKYAQRIKELVPQFRKEILTEINKHVN
jgi:septum formation topological specificity factor MinE